MTSLLRYGREVPELSDCVDLGVIPDALAPKKIANVGDMAGNLFPTSMYGCEIPPHRRAWMVIAHFRKKDVPTPWRCEIPGLGTLVYDNKSGIDNWEVL